MPSRQPEARIIRRALDLLRTTGFAEKLHGGARQRMGLPDIVAVLDGYAVWVEVKVPGGKATKIQEVVMEEIRAAGGWAGVITSTDDLTDLVELRPPLVCRRCLRHDCTPGCPGTASH